jgi:hypothetical protein
VDVEGLVQWGKVERIKTNSEMDREEKEGLTVSHTRFDFLTQPAHFIIVIIELKSHSFFSHPHQF